MNLESAKNIVEFCHITDLDDQGRAKIVLVPGHKSKRYQVTITRTKQRMICSCQELDLNEPCKGNSFGTVCYHTLAALLAAVNKNGHLIFFQKLEHPSSLVCPQNRLLEVASADGPSRLWALFYPFPRKKRVIKVQHLLFPIPENVT
jgi:hypothetical protein